jgi:hypothetical protein
VAAGLLRHNDLIVIRDPSAALNFDAHFGRRVTAGLPGTRLFWTESAPARPGGPPGSSASVRAPRRRRPSGDLLGHVDWRLVRPFLSPPATVLQSGHRLTESQHGLDEMWPEIGKHG